MLIYFKLPHAWCMIGQKFATPKIDYWCAPPRNSSFEKWNTSKWRAFSSPSSSNSITDEPTYNRCQIYDVKYDESLHNGINGEIVTSIF